MYVYVCECVCVSMHVWMCWREDWKLKLRYLLNTVKKKKNTVFACLDPQIYFWFVCHFWWQKFRLYDFGTDFDTPVAWYCTYELRDIVYEQIYKQRFANKGPSTQSFGFSSSHVWMWELDCKESWVLKNWCFWTMVLEKTLESPLGNILISSLNSITISLFSVFSVKKSIFSTQFYRLPSKNL